MAKQTKHLGLDAGKGSDKILSPQNPQTGDGKTTRTPHDPVIARDENGKVIR